VLTRWRAVAAIVATLISIFALNDVGAVADPLSAPPVVVTPGNSGTVNIGVDGPGNAGKGGGSTDTGGGGTQIYPCSTDAGSAACVAYQQANFCSTIAGDWAGGMKVPSLNNLSPAQLASLNGSLATNGCPPWNGGVAPPTAADLAQSAYGQLMLPYPVPLRYPAGTLQDGRPYTIVNTHMWFWSDRAVWKPLSKTVCAGALCATATARPSSLSFDPGNGDQSASCAGPGTRFVRLANESWAPGKQPQGCDYEYTRSTYGLPNGVLTATYTITWTVSWTATNGTAGTLNPLTTAANSTFAVAELQSVVTR